MANTLFFERGYDNSLFTGLYDFFNTPSQRIPVEESAWTGATGSTATTDTIEFLKIQALLGQAFQITQRFEENATIDISEVFDLKPLATEHVILKIKDTKPGTFYFISDDIEDLETHN
jgi:hypothetical protein